MDIAAPFECNHSPADSAFDSVATVRCGRSPTFSAVVESAGEGESGSAGVPVASRDRGSGGDGGTGGSGGTATIGLRTAPGAAPEALGITLPLFASTPSPLDPCAVPA